jgi:methionine synthase I (cobalamin-dependent)
MNQNSPTILSGIAVAGVLSTAYLAAKATLKANERIKNLETIPLHEDSDEFKLSSKEKVQLCWKYYIPAGASGIATVSCIIGANQIGLRRHAAMVGAYTLAETAFREYKEQVVGEIGEIKERGIRDKVAIQQMEKHPVKDAQVIITGGGEDLCFDTYTGRYFRSDIETIRRAQNEVNHLVNVDMYCAHNEFYELVGLSETLVGDQVGWNIDNTMDLSFTPHINPDNGKPCLAINYVRLPLANYHKF